MSEAAEKRTAANGIVKVNTLAELGRDFAPVASSTKLGWHGFSLERYRLPDNAASGEKLFNRHLLAVNHTGFYKDTICAAGGKRTIVRRPGDLVLYPAHFSSSAYDAVNVNQTILYLEPFFVERAVQDLIVGERIELVPQPTFYNEFISDIAKHLLAEVESNGANGALYAESLMTALAVKLIKNYSTARILPPEYKGGLSKRNLRLTIEFIDEHLSESLSLETLAALCDLSRFHFAKAFKRSTGLAPHKYVLQQRIERAKHLLIETNSTVVEIALTLGFADQPHFTKVFRQHTGTTPTGFQLQSR